MFLSIIAFIIFILVPNFLFAQVQYHSFEYDGFTRDYIVFLPQDYDGITNFPIVFNLHGYGHHAQGQMDYSGMNTVADTAGFFVIYPNAIDNAWNSGLSENPAWPTPNVDDVGFINALIDTLYNHYSIDTTRIYSCGFSNGGFMSFKLACQLNLRIAAVASVAGVISANTASNCNAQDVVPVLHIHGTADPVVPYDGGSIGWYSAEQTLEHWVDLDYCSNPDTTTIPDLDPSDNCTVEKITYQECKESSGITFYKVLNGGHTWPGSTIDLNFSTHGNTNHDINANNEIWHFLYNYELIPTGIEDNQAEIIGDASLLPNYPNPFNPSTTIEFSLTRTEYVELKVYSILGKEVAILVSDKLSQGKYTHQFDGKNLASGIYFYRIEAGTFSEVKKMVLIR